jgi:mono/diheme cytochrome c family protein
MIKNGKTNVMPGQAPKLSADQIHVVAAYVLSIGGLPTMGAAPASK